MKLLALIWVRLIDVIDIVFDAAGGIWRVLVRGAFSPDPQSYRGERFAPLPASNVLIEEIALNARDIVEARNAVALDPERYLPLRDQALFDVVGPIDPSDSLRSRPERIFVLGLVREDALTRLREDAPGRSAAIERFTFAPPAHPSFLLTFADTAGNRRLRFRRTVLAIALAAFCYAGSDTFQSWTATVERSVAQAESERVVAERRIRLIERRLHEAETALAAQSAHPSQNLGEIGQRLSRLGLQLPAQSEIQSLELTAQGLDVRGKSYAPDATELAFRRAFEATTIQYTAAAGPTPQEFEARFEARFEQREAAP